MKQLEKRILKEGKVFPGDVLKVNSFLNHQIDVPFMSTCAKRFHTIYQPHPITKILTIEASGIGIACLTARYFHCPVLFAKKAVTSNMSDDVYTAGIYSYTHQQPGIIAVSSEFLNEDDQVLIIDDFLANGSALEALIDLCNQAGAKIIGCGVVIEKAYQPGGARIRAQGIRVESLARIKSMSTEKGIEFCD